MKKTPTKKTTSTKSVIDFQPIFDYFDQRLIPIEERLSNLEKKTDSLTNSIDKLAGQVYSFQQEMVLISFRQQRMEHWIMQASKQIGVPYEA